MVCVIIRVSSVRCWCELMKCQMFFGFGELGVLYGIGFLLLCIQWLMVWWVCQIGLSIYGYGIIE